MRIIRKVIFFNLVFFLMIKGISQEYFNNRYNIPGEELYDFATTILTISDGYLIGVESGSSDNPDRRRLTLVEIDLFGQMTGVKFYGQQGVHYGIGYPGFLIRTKETGYALTGFRRSPYPGWVRTQGILMRLDENCDTLWMKLYGDQIEPCDTELIIRQVKQLPDKGFVLFGGPMDYNDQRPHFTLIRTDSLGNKIWQKYYGEPPYLYFAYCFAITSDDGFIMAGWRYTYPQEQSCDPYLIKTDNLGNEEWSLNLGSEFMDNAAFVDTTVDGNIIAGTVIADSMLYPDGFYGRICFTKVDYEGDIVWQKKYGISYFDNRLWSIKSLTNGKIVATGSRQRFYPEVPYRIGWILCTDSEGDSLWYREYTLVQGEYSWNFLYEIVQTNDSGFIACGYINPVSPDPGPQSTWVIKVDSIGCESLQYCWVGEEEPEGAPVQQGRLTAYPNPARERVTFSMPGKEMRAGTRITVYNIYGKKVYDQILPEPSDKRTVDVSCWPPGMYVSKIHFTDQCTCPGKFLVE